MRGNAKIISLLAAMLFVESAVCEKSGVKVPAGLAQFADSNGSLLKAADGGSAAAAAAVIYDANDDDVKKASGIVDLEGAELPPWIDLENNNSEEIKKASSSDDKIAIDGLLSITENGQEFLILPEIKKIKKNKPARRRLNKKLSLTGEVNNNQNNKQQINPSDVPEVVRDFLAARNYSLQQQQQQQQPHGKASLGERVDYDGGFPWWKKNGEQAVFKAAPAGQSLEKENHEFQLGGDENSYGVNGAAVYPLGDGLLMIETGDRAHLLAVNNSDKKNQQINSDQHGIPNSRWMGAMEWIGTWFKRI